jgi:menaquinone-dependent protoporphyrinogen IX oxidase
MKALIVYGTRYGATAGTAEEIAKILRSEGVDVRIVNAKEEKVDSISEYDLILVGSGLQMDKWTREPEEFLKKHRDELATKKLAFFVSSASWPIAMKEGKPEEREKIFQKHLLEKAAQYSLEPIAMGLFGGVWNYNKMGWVARKAMEGVKKKLAEVGFEEKDGVYDTRDWDEIRKWTKELIKKVRG